MNQPAWRSGAILTVLFDLDDTLLDSFAARASALQDVFSLAGVDTPTAAELLKSSNGRPLDGMLAEFQARNNIEVDLFGEYRRAYWKLDGLTTLYPGVRELLQQLHARGVKLGIVTQKERDFVLEGRQAGAALELRNQGVFDYFSVVIGYEDVAHHKPDPEGVNLALERHGSTPRQTLLVGDSAADIIAASAAGCWSCHATWGVPPGAPGLKEGAADITIDSPAALLRFL